jgi:patatin-like phospholipase/acyl hydrolase
MARRRSGTARSAASSRASSAASGAASGAAGNFRILCLDGGGIRGIITAIWLRELETILGGPARDSFDLIAGTSTGSILACAVAMGKRPDEIINLYETRGQTIFPGLGGRLWSGLRRTFTEGVSHPKYDGVGLDNELRAAFGAPTFGSLPKKTMVVCYDTFNREARIFKSWRSDHDYVNCPVWEIVRSSCSAPTYFPAFDLRINGVSHSMIDGGVAANNPTACAIAEGVRLNDTAAAADRIPLEKFVVLSLGTGALTRPIPLASAQEWGAVEWSIPVIDVLFDGSADVTDYIAAQLLETRNYHRLQTQLTDAYDDMDNASPANINALKAVAQAYLRREGTGKLEQLAERL